MDFQSGPQPDALRYRMAPRSNRGIANKPVQLLFESRWRLYANRSAPSQRTPRFNPTADAPRFAPRGLASIGFASRGGASRSRARVSLDQPGGAGYSVVQHSATADAHSASNGRWHSIFDSGCRRRSTNRQPASEADQQLCHFTLSADSLSSGSLPSRRERCQSNSPASDPGRGTDPAPGPTASDSTNPRSRPQFSRFGSAVPTTSSLRDRVPELLSGPVCGSRCCGPAYFATELRAPNVHAR